MNCRIRTAIAFPLLLVSLLVAVPVAMADALVVVHVRAGEQPVDGQVTLTPKGEGDAKQCQTTDGNCRIDGVPGGQYVVTFAPGEGQAPAPRSVMIPPSGTVTLNVAAR